MLTWDYSSRPICCAYVGGMHITFHKKNVVILDWGVRLYHGFGFLYMMFFIFAKFKIGLAEQDSFHLHPTQVSKPKQSEKMQKENTQSPLQIHDQKLKGDDGQTGFGATRPNAT